MNVKYTMATLNDGNVGMEVGMSMPVKWDISLLGDFYPVIQGRQRVKAQRPPFLDPEVCSQGWGV